MERMKAEIARKKMVKLFPHPPYSLTDLQRLLGIRRSQRMHEGKKFGSREEDIAQTRAYFEA